VSGLTTHRPIPYMKLSGSISDMHFFEEEFLDAFPNCNPWVIHGLHQMDELHRKWVHSKNASELCESFKQEFEQTCEATVGLMSMSELEWSAKNSHPNTPYGALFRKEIAEQLLIGK
jgi:hypothetical protein